MVDGVMGCEIWDVKCCELRVAGYTTVNWGIEGLRNLSNLCINSSSQSN